MAGPIVDDFEATTRAPTWAASSGTPTQTGGQMLLDAGDVLASSVTVDLSNGYEYFDVTGVDLTRESLLSMVSGQDALQWRISAGVAYAELVVGGTATLVGQVAYSATATRVFQIRGRAGSVFFEYGASPTTLRAVVTAGTPVPFDLSSLIVRCAETSTTTNAQPGIYAATYVGTY